MILTILTYIYVIAFVLFFFGFCIFIHELGHFLAAKWRKLHIVAFSLGFKKVWSYKHKGIDYRIGCLPFGGYVDIPQLDSTGPVKDEEGKELPNVKPLDRIIVAFAGPFFNVLFGFFLGTFLWIYGIPSTTPVMDSIKVASVVESSPEYNAGLRSGDKIVSINGQKFHDSWDKVVQKVIFTIGKVSLGVETNSGIKTISYEPAINSDNSGMAKEGLPYPFFKPEIPLVITVEKDSPAEKAGLKTGDIITRINDKDTPDYENYFIAISSATDLNITLVRDGKKLTITNVKTTELPEAQSYMIGVVLNAKTDAIKIAETKPDSPAMRAGLKSNDIVLKINGITPDEKQPIQKTVNDSKGKIVTLSIQRDGKIFDVKVKPELFIPHYLNGISLVYYNHLTPWEQFMNVVTMSYQSLRGIFSKDSHIKAKHMSGPIGIVTVIGTAVYHGSILHALNIITIITFSLALLNLLPLPVLDGGHILFSLIEMVIRRPLPAKLMKPICTAFVALLIFLMLFVTFNDINRITNFSKFFQKEKSSGLPQARTESAKK